MLDSWAHNCAASENSWGAASCVLCQQAQELSVSEESPEKALEIWGG